MSTKIFNAFYIEGNNYKDIQEIIDYFRIIEKEYKINKFIEIVLRSYYSFLIFNGNFRDYLKDEDRDVLLVADKLFNNNSVNTFYKMILKIVDHYINNAPENINNLFVISNKLFYRSFEDKTLFIVSGTSANSIYKDIINNSKAKEYCYYNHTDKPNNVSSKDWKKREKDWDFIKYYIADVMVSINSCSNLSLLGCFDGTNKLNLLASFMDSNIEKINSNYLNFNFKNLNDLDKEIINSNLAKGSFTEYSKFERKTREKTKKSNIFEEESFFNYIKNNNINERTILNDILYKKINYEIPK